MEFVGCHRHRRSQPYSSTVAFFTCFFLCKKKKTHFINFLSYPRFLTFCFFTIFSCPFLPHCTRVSSVKLSNAAILAVGTFQTSTSDFVTGNITTFEVGGTSGKSYLTTTVGDSDHTLNVTDSQKNVQMNNNILTSDAVAVHMGTTAYILDKVVY